MTAGTGFTLFIPVYNEEALLVPNVNRLVRFLGDTGIPFEILIGSNGSTDGSLNLLKQLSLTHDAVRYFGLPQKGVGAAFRLGVLRARYDRIITVDMDLSIHLDFIRHAYRLLDRYDMVIGSKITGSQKRSWVRKAASGAFIVLARLMLNIYFHDYSIAAKAYRRETAQRYLPFLDDKTFYVVQMVYRASLDGKRLKEVPVACEDLRSSRFNLIHEGVYKFGNLFLLWLKSRRQRRPCI